MLIEHFWQSFLIFSAQFSNAISSEVPRLIDFKFYGKHPGKSLYADRAILSAERQRPVGLLLEPR